MPVDHGRRQAKPGGVPAGSTTRKRVPPAPPASRAASPLPSGRSRPGSRAAAAVSAAIAHAASVCLRSGLADRLDHRRRDRLLRRLAAPDHELERRIEALAFRQGDIDQILNLLGAGGADPAQQYRMTKGRRVVFGREIEMPEPQLLVGQRQKLVKRRRAGPSGPSCRTRRRSAARRSPPATRNTADSRTSGRRSRRPAPPRWRGHAPSRWRRRFPRRGRSDCRRMASVRQSKQKSSRPPRAARRGNINFRRQSFQAVNALATAYKSKKRSCQRTTIDARRFGAFLAALREH